MAVASEQLPVTEPAPFKLPLTIYEGTLVDTPAFGQLRLRPDGKLVVDADGLIVADLEAGSSPGSEALRQAIADGSVIRLESGQFLMPGFVDCHIHAPQFSYTGTGLDLPLMGPEGWLEKYTFPAERQLGEDELEAERRYQAVVSQTLRRGTTTALYFATLHLAPSKTLARVANRLGQRAIIGKVSMDRHSPADYTATAAQNVADTEAFIDFVEANCSDRISAAITPRFVPTCSLELLRGLGQLAVRHPKVLVQTHVAESLDEVAFCRALHPECPRDAALLEETGLLPGPGRAVLAHGVHLSDAELDRLAAAGAAVAHCPLSNAYFANGVFRVKEALARGVRVGLGTDVAGGYDPSMLSALRSAVWASRQLENGVAIYDFGDGVPSNAGPSSCRKGSVIDHAEALWLATLGGAEALGLEAKIGSFAPGKAFDALIVDPRAPDSALDVFPEDSEDDALQKFLHVGDDRNVIAVYVQGRRLHARAVAARNEVIGLRVAGRGSKRSLSGDAH